MQSACLEVLSLEFLLRTGHIYSKSYLPRQFPCTKWCMPLGARSWEKPPSIPFQHGFMRGWPSVSQNGGWRQVYSRPFNRGLVWINREGLLPANEFCGFEPNDHPDEVALFYGTSYEFIRSLEAKHGIKQLNVIVDDIEVGIGFEESLHDRLGGTCGELYAAMVPESLERPCAPLPPWSSLPTRVGCGPAGHGVDSGLRRNDGGRWYGIGGGIEILDSLTLLRSE